MENRKAKEILAAGLMGVTGFVAPYALFCLIIHFTDVTSRPILPVKYLVPAFILSVVVWLYCFYVNRSVRKKEIK